MSELLRVRKLKFSITCFINDLFKKIQFLASGYQLEHCEDLWSNTCDHWKELMDGCKRRPLGCHYYQKQFWSCRHAMWRCGQDLEY